MLLIGKELKKLGLKEHLQDDSFEEFLRNKLNEFDDEPNNNMWDRVEGVIPPAPKPVLFRIMKPSAIAASMVLAVAVFAAVYQYTSKQNLNDQLIEATDKIKELENKIDEEINEETAQLEEIETVDNTIEENNIQEKEKTIHQNKSSNFNTNKSSNNTSNKKPSKKKNTTNSSKSNKNNKSYNTPSSIIDDKKQTPIANDKLDKNNKIENPQNLLNNNQLDKTPIANDNKTTEPSNNLNQNTPQNPLIKQNEDEAIAFGEPFLLDRIRNNEIDNYAYFIMVEQKPSTEKPTFQPKLVVGSSVYSFQTKPEFNERPGPPPPGGNPFKDHKVKPATGLAIGATIGLQLNKNWSIHSGLAYQQEKIKMKLVDHREYNKDRENDIGNNQEGYRTNYITHSPFGEIRVNGRFTKDKDDHIENRPFDIEIDGTHKLTSLNIPLYLQVQDQKNRFIYGLKAGVYGRNLINSSFNATEITSSISELKASEVTVEEQPQVSNKLTADFLYGAVLAYKHNNHLTFSLEPTGLISIGEKHKSPYGNTRMKSIGSQFGIKYTF